MNYHGIVYLCQIGTKKHREMWVPQKILDTLEIKNGAKINHEDARRIDEEMERVNKNSNLFWPVNYRGQKIPAIPAETAAHWGLKRRRISLKHLHQIDKRLGHLATREAKRQRIRSTSAS